MAETDKLPIRVHPDTAPSSEGKASCSVEAFRIRAEKLFSGMTAKHVIESTDFFQAVLDGMQDSIKIVDDRFRIIYANKASELRSGKEMPALLGKKCHSEFYDFDAPCSFCHTSKAFKSGVKELSSYSTKGGDGQCQYFELASYPIKDEAGTVQFVVEITKDVTDRKRLEQQLLHSERLASMGTLASSLAHEINNPLSVIVGFAQELLTEIPAESPHGASLKIIEQEALRCGRVLQSLLHFTRSHPPVMDETDLARVIQSVAGLIRPQAKKAGVETKVKVPKTLPKIQADSNQLEQLFLNLALNGLQAMPQGGTLTMQAECDHNRFRVTVSDTGEGIDPADLPRVFEPFFSRKAGAGTGLGLSVCKRIVNHHNGDIELQSEPGKGTKATVTLPVSAA